MSKYAKRPSDNSYNELRCFDWDNHSAADKPPVKRSHISIMGIRNSESPYDRKLRMLQQLSHTCIACTMCELGRQPAENGHERRDPHVLSNLNPTRFMVVDENPKWDDIPRRIATTSVTRRRFDAAITRYGLSRDDFYVCYAARCCTSQDTRPTADHYRLCASFLQIELNIIEPLVVITLGETVFAQFCPNASYDLSLKKITKSTVYKVPVFAMDHPWFWNKENKSIYIEQFKIMCKLVKAMKARHEL